MVASNVNIEMLSFVIQWPTFLYIFINLSPTPPCFTNNRFVRQQKLDLLKKSLFNSRAGLHCLHESKCDKYQ